MTDDELKGLFESMRRHFDVVSEATRGDLRLVAETIVLTHERIDRTTSSLGEHIERSSAETQAMIKFSHAEIDRRMRTLEERGRSLEDAVADLQARVGRLENSTH
ncbi:MAG: hypothetical protein ABI779_11505 [Acidobacteriota bacterium]